MDPEVKAAVAEAYSVFSRYSLQGLPAGVGPLEERLLFLTPLAEIPVALLASYTDSPHVWDGGKVADDFRALLPRYFELIAEGAFPTAGRKEDVLLRLAEADYRSKWRSDEVTAIDRFFAALLRAAVAEAREDDLALVTGLIRAAGGDVDSLRPLQRDGREP